MKTKNLLATLECMAAIHESGGASEKAALLRAFNAAVAPLAAADIKRLIEVLTCGRPVDRKPQ